jgi:hypothetical protein
MKEKPSIGGNISLKEKRIEIFPSILTLLIKHLHLPQEF